MGGLRFRYSTRISTSYVERHNLTMRMGMRRFIRLTNGFSKIENLEPAVALHDMNYNFARIHKTLRATPAMEVGVSDHAWSLEEIAKLAVCRRRFALSRAWTVVHATLLDQGYQLNMIDRPFGVPAHTSPALA